MAKQIKQPESNLWITVKMKFSALANVRKIAAHTGEKMHEVWDRISEAEWKKINRGGK